MIERIAKRWKGNRKVVGKGKRLFDRVLERRGLRVKLLVCVRESRVKERR
jgi:hypothetical protein